MSRAARRISVTTWLMLLALIVVLAGCKKADEPSQTTFASPDDAGNGLLTAAKTGDLNPMLAIFGTRLERHHLLRRCRAGQSHGGRICGRL